MELLVTADDRTGALETAAALADQGAGDSRGVVVTVWPDVAPDERVSVVDVATRHLTAIEAAERVTALAGDGVRAHKIDSTLRGNWAAELAAIHRSSGRAVLVVPALPELGRVCVGGEVTLDGRPVGEIDDVRLGGRSSRPADHLAMVGLSAVSLQTPADVAAWLRQGSGVGVADAATADDVDLIVQAWRAAIEPGSGCVLAGTSSVIGRAVGSDWRRRQLLATPALVVVGSASATARAQVELLLAAGLDPQLLVATDMPVGAVTGAAARSAAEALATAVDERLEQVEVDAIVVVGGDTTAAILGEAPVRVLGSLGQGTAWVVSPRFGQPVVTRAGGFGDDRALIDLVWGTLRA